MDFNDQNAKIYKYTINISIALVLIITCGIMFGISNNFISNKIMLNFLIICFAIHDLFIGTKKVVAQNNKKGYVNYLFSMMFFAIIVDKFI